MWYQDHKINSRTLGEVQRKIRQGEREKIQRPPGKDSCHDGELRLGTLKFAKEEESEKRGKRVRQQACPRRLYESLRK